ncbi:hypothetical protein EVAR_19241_1 [Eumeta japonica]|uniref:Uncharacterized protein n=1 Tax=Eumeta variegata TaxID=151549 RepID=A0A4C1VFM6_EUMVA|nr:hypothetical protein EVAR_19241_1 [Eumeta japonica]
MKASEHINNGASTPAAGAIEDMQTYDGPPSTGRHDEGERVTPVWTRRACSALVCPPTGSAVDARTDDSQIVIVRNTYIAKQG